MFGVTRAPEIDLPGLDWFNVERPLSLADLAGRLVILDFWTFCCINCLHIVPMLRKVEEAWPEEVAVIGVHSPKFAAEKDSANVAQAIARYGIVHPVIHDPERELWRAYAVRAWPTLVFVSPTGRVIGHAAGEPHPGKLLQTVSTAIDAARDGGEIKPQALALTRAPAMTGRFRFPGKIKPVPGAPKRWAVADAGHHQIVLLDDGGMELARFGSGEAGLEDGPAGTARFNGPQGLAATAETIYVADTRNHAVRAIDLAADDVTTLAGTGMRGPVLGDEMPATGMALASPWDLEILGERLFFANAGTHQLGEIDLRAGLVRRLAGGGGENIVDGPAAQAQLAQPSGLALSPGGDRLFFADSETSSIRCVSLGTEPAVTTLVGAGLFEFGHVNGPFEKARLQHALGVAWAGGTGGSGGLLVADSYNGALRLLDLTARDVRDVDDGFTCTDDVCLPLGEPAGAWADGAGRILLSDTNNHRIVEYRVAAREYGAWAA